MALAHNCRKIPIVLYVTFDLIAFQPIKMTDILLLSASIKTRLNFLNIHKFPSQSRNPLGDYIALGTWKG